MQLRWIGAVAVTAGLLILLLGASRQHLMTYLIGAGLLTIGYWLIGRTGSSRRLPTDPVTFDPPTRPIINRDASPYDLDVRVPGSRRGVLRFMAVLLVVPFLQSLYSALAMSMQRQPVITVVLSFLITSAVAAPLWTSRRDPNGDSTTGAAA